MLFSTVNLAAIHIIWSMIKLIFIDYSTMGSMAVEIMPKGLMEI